jgi:hypothetical protein
MDDKIIETGERRLKILARTAKEVRQYRISMKVLSALLVMLITVTAIIYIIAVLYERTGSFTVRIDKYEMTKYGLSLSESRDMMRPTSNLNAKVSEKMTNIAGETIDANVDMIEYERWLAERISENLNTFTSRNSRFFRNTPSSRKSGKRDTRRYKGFSSDEHLKVHGCVTQYLNAIKELRMGLVKARQSTNIEYK